MGCADAVFGMCREFVTKSVILNSLEHLELSKIFFQLIQKRCERPLAENV